MSKPERAALSVQYLRFAGTEARGRSPLYEALAQAVAGDAATLDFLMGLPREKRQPNLLLAVMRHLFGTPEDWPRFRANLLANADAVRSVMLARSTQTNEPARCATLLPVLACLPQPLALIEVGASAGLCLLPDCYGYDYGGRLILPLETGIVYPVFSCAANATTPLPKAMPRVVWRAGLDLNPVDAADPSQVSWLEALVWPEQTTRLTNLRSALRITAAYRPRIVRGNLRGDDLRRLCGEAPATATLVVFHTAVLAYVADRAERRAFARHVTSLCPYWISNESPQVFPEIAGRTELTCIPGQFLMSVNGAPIAWTDPHGAALEWIADHEWVPNG